MKNAFIFLVSMFCILTISCRKEELRSDIIIASESANGGAHCYNGIMDSDEVGTDCGGSCGSCDEFAGLCTDAVDNTIRIRSTTSNVDRTVNFISDTAYVDTDGEYHLEAITSDNDKLHITFGYRPDATLAYKVTSSTVLNECHVSVDVNGFGKLSSSPLSSGAQYVYLTDSNGRYSFRSCDLSIGTFVGFGTTTFSFTFEVEGDLISN